MKASIRVLVMVALTSLACSGAATTSPSPAPAPSPKPSPRADPAPNAGDCSKFFGVSLPQSGGTITKCAKNKVTISHGDEASKAKWSYADAYVAKGWSRGDPEKGSPTVFKDAKKLVFSSSGSDVQITKR